MTYKLVYYGNRTLRQVAEEVVNIDQKISDLIDSMYNIMYAGSGIGLAAPQVDVSKKIITLNLQMYNGPSLALINPIIIGNSEEIEPYEEGCLSIPGIRKEIYRPSKISVKGLTLDEKEVQIDADGLLARVLQHEIDHLNGIFFTDHLEDYLRKELTSQLKKIKKLNHAS
ncbi:MAG: peptide deformylase [Spirochaetota bacterium]|nr:peptide deformylase [Spirochaetota bacterium]